MESYRLPFFCSIQCSWNPPGMSTICSFFSLSAIAYHGSPFLSFSGCKHESTLRWMVFFPFSQGSNPLDFLPDLTSHFSHCSLFVLLVKAGIRPLSLSCVAVTSTFLMALVYDMSLGLSYGMESIPTSLHLTSLLLPSSHDTAGQAFQCHWELTIAFPAIPGVRD